MSRNPKRIPVRIVNPLPGARDITSLAHARRYVHRGVARFTSSGSLEFLHRRAECNGPQMEAVPFRAPIADSGVSGFLRYPQPSYLSGGPRYPGLAR